MSTLVKYDFLHERVVIGSAYGLSVFIPVIGTERGYAIIYPCAGQDGSDRHYVIIVHAGAVWKTKAVGVEVGIGNAGIGG